MSIVAIAKPACKARRNVRRKTAAPAAAAAEAPAAEPDEEVDIRTTHRYKYQCPPESIARALDNAISRSSQSSMGDASPSTSEDLRCAWCSENGDAFMCYAVLCDKCIALDEPPSVA